MKTQIIYSDQEILDSLQNWKEIIAKYQVPDTKKAGIQILDSFVPFIALWVLMYYSLSWSYWITLSLAFVNAFFLVRIFIIQHDCGHQSFLESRKWNRFIGDICSLVSALPFKYWARMHNHHHGHSSQLEHSVREVGDIKFLTVEEYANLSKWKQVSYQIFRFPLFVFVIAPIVYFTISNRLPFYAIKGNKKMRWEQIASNIMFAIFIAGLCWLVGWRAFLKVHIPIIFMFSVIAFWFFYVQHQHEHNYKKWRKEWDFLLSSIRGATHYDLPKLFQWLTGNIGFHHIHHLSASIPNYNLEKCYKENPILNKYVSSITFRQSLKFIYHKLWDPETQRMISFREYRLLYKKLA